MGLKDSFFARNQVISVIFHQSLDRKSRKLLQAAQIPEVCDDSLIVFLLQEPLKPDLDLCLHFISLGHCHISHIIGNSHDANMTALDHTHCCAHPGCNLLLYSTVRPVPCNDLAFDFHSCKNMPELAAAVSRLILVHEVHINSIIWNFLVKLGMKMKQRLPILLETKNPGFGW